MRTLTAFDVDTDALADALERMAEGVRGSGGVMVEEVETGHVARVEDTSAFDFRLRFAADYEYRDVVDAIEYETETDDPSRDEPTVGGDE